MCTPPACVDVLIPGFPPGFQLVRTRIYTIEATGHKYDMRLVRHGGEPIRGTPAGSSGFLQVNLGAGGRWYLHRIMGFERHRLEFGEYPSEGAIA